MNSLYEKLLNEKSLWEIFTLKEDYSPIKLNKSNNFTYRYSSNKNILTPVVSKFLLKNGFNIEYPERKKFAICLTHDVDRIQKNMFQNITNLIYKFKKRKTISKNDVLFTKNYDYFYSTIKKIINLEKKYCSNSTFFLMADYYAFKYKYHLENYLSSLNFLIDNESEIGLHGSFEAYNNSNILSKEKRLLEKYARTKIVGYRSHYLKFNFPNTWEILVKNNFLYDSTIGFNDMVGFRNGMCHPFEPYNIKTNKIINLMEIPLVFMEGTLEDLKIEPLSTWNLFNILLKNVEKYKGVMTINFHSDSFSLNYRDSFLRLYENILKTCVNKNAYITNARGIYDIYKCVL